jgi:hypothetical protein
MYTCGMTIALRQQLRQHAFPNVSFGPLRFLEAMPWLVLAASMRIVAFNNRFIAIPAIIFASIAVLHAFLVVTQRSIEQAQGQTSLGALTFTEQSRLTRAILWRIGLLMIGAAIAVLAAGYAPVAPHMMNGLDGMAFDQFSGIGKFWSAIVAALVLLMVVDAEQNRGRVSFRRAAEEFARRSVWLGVAVIALGVIYLGLSFGQGLIRNALWQFYQTSAAQPLIKNLIFFVFIFSFATLRLWVTLLVLTWGLKQSYLRAG